MGGGKGGSDFDPKGKSDDEVMRFCQALMTELQRYIGPAIDVPAGDIGVGRREIGYLFGQYLRLEQAWAGALTGKGLNFGGSALRTEATGYGCIYFLEHVLERHALGLEGMKVAISGSGNVALYAARKAAQQGARVVTLSDSDGFIHLDSGLSEEQLEFARTLKEERRGRIFEVADEFSEVQYFAGRKPWSVQCDVALPCATQNELDWADASALIDNGVRVVCEGANMPATKEASRVLKESSVVHAPGKAANAGGVSVSGLEMSQNALRMSWTDERVDNELRTIMKDIHRLCVEHGDIGKGRIDYVDGANIAGFLKVAEALLAYGAT